MVLGLFSVCQWRQKESRYICSRCFPRVLADAHGRIITGISVWLAGDAAAKMWGRAIYQASKRLPQVLETCTTGGVDHLV